jgi:hypothetical protein
VALPVAAAVAATVVLTTRSGGGTDSAVHAQQTLSSPFAAHAADHPPAAKASAGAARRAVTVPASPKRLQDVSASLTLRERNQAALSQATRRAVSVATSLGGHSTSVHVSNGSAELVLAVPRTHVQTAIDRISALGTIADEQLDVQDVTGSVDATARTIARLQRELKTLRTAPATPASTRRIAALTRQVQGLQRAEAAARRRAHFGTVSVSLTTARPAATPRAAHHGPLHGLGVAFRWTGIGLVYALAFGVPLAGLWLVVRWVRRRREDALLSRA